MKNKNNTTVSDSGGHPEVGSSCEGRGRATVLYCLFSKTFAGVHRIRLVRIIRRTRGDRRHSTTQFRIGTTRRMAS